MSEPPPILHKLLWASLCLLLVGVAALGIVHEVRRRRTPAPVTEPENPRGPKLADFSLTDQLGRTVTRADFRGRVWIADFIFVQCPGPCPRMTRLMAELQDDLPGDVRFASFSVDPGRDTPEELKKYADRYGADSARWHFMTGERKEIYKVARELLLPVSEDEITENNIPHSVRFILVDRDGKVHKTYNSEFADDMRQIREDARKLVTK